MTRGCDEDDVVKDCKEDVVQDCKEDAEDTRMRAQTRTWGVADDRDLQCNEPTRPVHAWGGFHFNTGNMLRKAGKTLPFRCRASDLPVAKGIQERGGAPVETQKRPLPPKRISCACFASTLGHVPPALQQHTLPRKTPAPPTLARPASPRSPRVAIFPSPAAPRANAHDTMQTPARTINGDRSL